MENFSEHSSCKDFERSSLPYLLSTIKNFFGGDLRYMSKPIEWLLDKHGIDISENPRRGVYIINDHTAIILGRVLVGRVLTSVFAIKIENTYFSGMARVLNHFEAALASTLSKSQPNQLSYSPHRFGEELVEFAVSQYFSKGSFDHNRFRYVIQVFHKLANTRFEGRNFTTGLILTRSNYAFAEKRHHSREGKLFPLIKAQELSPANDVEKRFWYLADGQTSYFVANENFQIGNLFIASDPSRNLNSFVDDYSLSKTVKGTDALFRVTSQSEFSITGTEGIEFNFKEGRWRVRNLKEIARVLVSSLNVSEKFVQSFLYYVFYLSKRRMSSILWIPENSENVNGLLLNRNQLTKTPFSILERSHTQSLLRLLSSDGASIFLKDGTLLSFGSVIDISQINVDGVKGTGESVSKLLASNGVSVKISQDGTIKLYPGASIPPMVI